MFVAGSNAYTTTTATSIQLPVPAEARAGDLCLVVCSTDSNGVTYFNSPDFTRYIQPGAATGMYTDLLGRIWDGSAGPITVNHTNTARTFTVTGLWFRNERLERFGDVGIRSGTNNSVTAPGVGAIPEGARVWALFGDRSNAANAGEAGTDLTLTWGAVRYFGQGNPALSSSAAISTVVLVEGTAADTGPNTAVFADSSANAWGMGMVLAIDADPYKAEVLADNPLVYLPLDGSTLGEAVRDVSGYGRTFTVPQGNLALGNPPLITVGGNSAEFQSSAYLACNPAPWAVVSSVTLEVWALMPGITGTANLAMWDRDSSGRVFQFRVQSTRKVEFLFWTEAGGWYSVTGSTTLAAREVRHIAATYDHTTGTARVYVDGVLDGTLTVTASPLKQAQQTLVLGASDGGAAFGMTVYYPFSGRLDECAYYGTALSAERIAAHYAAGTAAGFNDCWVWDGTEEVPANTSVWDGAVEIPTTMEVV